ncbi:MAG TPA: hypothetical protein VGW10_00390, partial [Solirubrobacteraceae bacterium]|nr:hypothetical protein [Solirubrobacteraceae bacterium]
MSRTARAVALALSLTALSAAPAAAATTVTNADPAAPGFIVAVAAGTTANNVTVSFDQATFELVYADTADTLTAGGTCTNDGANEVRCPFATAQGTDFSLGGGSDSYTFDNATLPAGPLPPLDSTVRAGEGADTVKGSNLGETILGGGGADVLLDGEGGDDVIEGGLGDDRIEGGPDSLSTPGPPPGPDQVFGDTVSYESSGQPIEIFLTDTLIGGNANNGTEGFDTTTGIENVRGSAFDDSITGTATNDFGQGGANRLEGLGGVDELEGDPATITPPATGGSDVLLGGPGTDDMNGGGQPQFNAFGPGAAGDTVDYSDVAGGGVQIRLEPVAGVQHTEPLGLADSGSDTFEDVEHAIGSEQGDDIAGATRVPGATPFVPPVRSGDNSLRGLGGDDIVRGEPDGAAPTAGGNDTLAGGAGGDDLSGGPDGFGSGGPSADSVDYASEGDRPENQTFAFPGPPTGGPGKTGVTVTLDGTADDGSAFDGQADNVREDVEHVTGSSSDDVLTGDGDANDLSGFDGNDTLNGEGGDDRLHGGRDAD